MTAYTVPHSLTISRDIAAKKAAQRKVVEKAHKLERESYKAMMQRRRAMQGATNLDRMV